MPWTRRQVRYLESSGSPLTSAQKDKMNSELHANPSMGHKRKGSTAMMKPPYHHTMITHHGDGSHTVEHVPHMKSHGKSGAFMEQAEPTTYSATDHGEMMAKLDHHLSPEGGEHEAEEEGGAKPVGAPEEEEGTVA